LHVDYWFESDSNYVILEPGETFSGTVDIEKFFDLNIEKGSEYIIWFEYSLKEIKYRPKDKKMREIPIWQGDIRSNKLVFIPE
jgi:hypothetical protein